MDQNKVNNLNFYIILLVCTLVGGVLNLVNLPDWLFYFRPDWVALFFYGLLSGLFLDLILVKPLGLNAIGFVVLAYLVGYWSSQIRALTLWQQCLFLVILLAFCKLLIGLAAILTTDFVFTRFYWYSALGNFIFWPLLFMILQEVKQAFLTEQNG